MGVQTDYDDKRDELRERLNECVMLAKELLAGEDIWGYDQMPDDYAMKVYMAVKNARDKV